MPIKRSTQLAPLSREHHEGLLFAWKLRQGIAKNIEPMRMISFVQWFWHQHLNLHFKKEELFLPPVLSTGHPLMQQMIQEHIKIETLIKELEPYEVLKKLEQLAILITDHIRFEERQLFGEIEKAATPEQLQLLSENLKDEKTDTVWKDAFWLKSL